MDTMEIQLAAQRLLLLQLYKRGFLADPDARGQLATELLAAVAPPGDATDGTIDVPRQDALKRELAGFFADVERMVDQVRHQPLRFPPA